MGRSNILNCIHFAKEAGIDRSRLADLLLPCALAGALIRSNIQHCIHSAKEASIDRSMLDNLPLPPALAGGYEAKINSGFSHYEKSQPCYC